MRIDAHQHFWRYSAADYGWIDGAMDVLKRDYLPDDLAAVLQRQRLDGSIAVQARQCEDETRWLLQLARDKPRILAVIGWIDLQAEDLDTRLAAVAGEAQLKGFRHVLQDEAEPGFMLRPAFVRGLQRLAQLDYCYELLIKPQQLPEACSLLQQLPPMRLVLDHVAKPDIRGGDLAAWRAGIAELGSHPHLYCKVSGLVTEAHWNGWSAVDFEPCLEHVFDCFGPQRLMFGSDWPVCLLAAPYAGVQALLADFVRRHYPEHEAAVFGDNARRFYGL
uniref:amidohydrolase family protein n=1 Tax=Marinobacterium profundum TaxID=1714300 RepID=UPI00082C9D2D|nr:amidohydrolase family protein [Marinobacterium profundum]